VNPYTINKGGVGMDWDSILKFFHFEPKIRTDAEGNQVGIVTVRNENSNNKYDIIINLPSDPKTAEAFARGLQSPRIEEKAKEETQRELNQEPFRTLIGTLSPSTQEEVVAKTMGLSAVGEVGLRGNVQGEKFGVTEFVAGKIRKREK
jgi:hypothetical protein